MGKQTKTGDGTCDGFYFRCLYLRRTDDRTEENFKAFKKQRNKCVKLLRNAKFDYYRNIDLGNLTDNHKFWKTVKPLFSDKVQVNSTIT